MSTPTPDGPAGTAPPAVPPPSPAEPAARLSIACADPSRVARFWAALLGGEPTAAPGGGVALAPPGSVPALLLRPVGPGGSAGDGAVVPEFTVDDVPATAARARHLGATGDAAADADRAELRDPEGTRFALLRRGGALPAPAATATAAAVGSMTLLAAAVVVHDTAADRVVMLRRGPRATFGRGLWDVPVGKCDPGEAVPAAAVRELHEETGLVVDPADLRLGHVVHGARGAQAPGGFLTVVFVTERWSGELVNREPAKHSEARWMPTGDLPSDVVFSADRLLEAVLSGRPGVTARGWS
ncbi:NUDIX domain-containing protein [Streptomyces spiramenti]|uniref:NUDIX domain-containing protein n=1 Tax=Streptomyces spiramenti TaxID=2720606 RepID=A0ABX1AHU1_9ACTN|nr:NUDIX domain-containing protein [Streptomyces spiramenti]NJP66729.1 NUDIX domain-containing protein [Streptomyces spiramenti]